MFPATILVALLVGFDVDGLVLSGVATIIALIISRWTALYSPLLWLQFLVYCRYPGYHTGPVWGVPEKSSCGWLRSALSPRFGQHARGPDRLSGGEPLSIVSCRPL